MERIYNLLHKFQGLLQGLALFLILLSVSVRFTGTSIQAVWKDYPMLAILILLAGLILILLYIQIDRWKLKQLHTQIQTQGSEGNKKVRENIHTLSKRQKEVYEKIIQGKSNKEIRGELFIEASTLKTHINQIYKKLDIKSRGELRRLLEINKANVED